MAFYHCSILSTGHDSAAWPESMHVDEDLDPQRLRCLSSCSFVSQCDVSARREVQVPRTPFVDWTITEFLNSTMPLASKLVT